MRGRLVHLFLVAAMFATAIVPIVSPAKAADAPAVSFLFGSGSQTGGRRITLRVRLAAPAPAGGTTVTLGSSSSAVQIPATGS